MSKTKGTRRGAKKWPREKLIEIVIEVGSLAGSRKDSDPMWPLITANMVAIYRSESAKIKSIDDYNTTAGYAASTASAQLPDPNEEDFD